MPDNQFALTSSGNHKLMGRIISARIAQFDQTRNVAILQLGVQSPLETEHQAGPPSTTLAVELHPTAAHDLWISLSHMAQRMDWKLGGQSQVTDTPTGRL